MTTGEDNILNRNNKPVLKWELAGILFVFLLGALLHFVYQWSGDSAAVGAIASVNESVWEHFKQGFWPMCLYAAVEFRFISKYTRNFLAAKAVAMYLLPTVTGLVFYAYSSILGKEILIVDILIFALAIVMAQLASYKIMTGKVLPGFANRLGLAMIIALGLVLILFTFYPPHLPILVDRNTGAYGLP